MAFLNLSLFLIAVFLFSVFTTGLVRKYSLRFSLIDIPNERSSHNRSTPRGGGLSIALSALLALGLMYYYRYVTLNMLLAIGGGGLIVAIVGWLDDHRHINPLIRGLIYTIASIWAIYFLKMPIFDHIMAILGLVWLINLYNFMDGTDALAATQSICTGIFLGILFLLSGHQELAGLCFIIVAASGGFVCWNWPPAKIFMGDVGSCFLGFYFGCLGILGEKYDSVTILVWFILLAMFICDTTLTLIMRILKREKWYSAHRSHAYQRLVQMGVSHKELATGFLLINIILLWPLAYIAYHWQNLTWVISSGVALIICCLWMGIQLRFSHTPLAEK
jgi:UDP-N-acetylmuramyl pentapeptide phosphotransferase/UDP-N-acetylglucosamine-1-phosphate transferase